MTTTQITPTSNLRPVLAFTFSILQAGIKNYKVLIFTLGLPTFMLFTFWVTTIGATGEDAELMKLMFPAIVAMSVLLSGLSQATRLANWRAQNIFQRLALTPVPLTGLVSGAAAAQIVMGILQGILMLVIGSLLVGVRISLAGFLQTLGIMILAGATFIAFGSLVATFTSRADVAGYAFFALFIPLFFLGSFPAEMLPPILRAITPFLPTSMVIELIGALLYDGHLPANALFDMAGLAVYLLLFTILYVRRFRWDG